MTKKKIRMIRAKIIRKATGIPVVAAIQFARAIEAGNSLYLVGNPANKFWRAPSFGCGPDCCGLDYFETYIDGPRGQITKDQIAEALSVKLREAEERRETQSENSKVKATRRQENKDRASNSLPKRVSPLPEATYLGPNLAVKTLPSGRTYFEPIEPVKLDSQAEGWLALGEGRWPDYRSQERVERLIRPRP